MVSFDDRVPASDQALVLRRQLMGRLRFLEGLGLATKAGAKTWRLAGEHRSALREMQLRRDVQKSFARGDLAIMDPQAERVLVRLEPGNTLRGRVAGTAANDLGEAPFLVLEATDGRVLLIPQTPSTCRSRAAGRSSSGASCSRSVSRSGRSMPRSWDVWRPYCGRRRARPNASTSP
jgi:hypothetical protein